MMTDTLRPATPRVPDPSGTTREAAPRRPERAHTPGDRARTPAGGRPSTADRPRLYALDGLRLLAAVGVMLYHFTARWSQVWGDDPGAVFPETGPVLIYAALGPEQFFVISGFVILMTAWGRDVPHVVASRVARLFPSYWLAVIATSTLLLFLWPAGKDISVGEALVNLTMLQELFGVRHVDGVYWTLYAELRFYLLIGLLVAWGITRRRLLWVAAVWPALGLVAVEAGITPLAALAIDGYAPFFAGGMMLYLIFREGHARAPWLILGGNVVLGVDHAVSWQMTSLTANTIFTPDPWVLGALTVGCFATVAVIALTPLQRLGWAWLVPAGALTYPLYLIHEYWGWWFIDLTAAHLGRWVVLAGAVTLSVMLAVVIHQIEKRVGPPMRRRVEAALRRAPEAESPTARHAQTV